MKILSCAILLAAVLSVFGCDDSPTTLPPKTLTEEEKTELLKLANLLWKAGDDNDLTLILDYTHPRAIELAGGREAMKNYAEQVLATEEEGGMSIEDLEIGEISQVYTADDGYVVFLPRRMIVEMGGKRVRSETFLIAIGDAGKWKFIDSNAFRTNPDMTTRLLPGLPDGLQLPPNVITLIETPTDVVADDDPLQPMNRLVGTWITKTYEKKTDWTPETRTATGKETIKWVLGKKFIQGDVIFPDGAKGHWLMNYDEQAKVYRFWFFGNKLQFPRGNTVGRWNPKAKRMDWKIDGGDGVRGEMTSQFHGKDKWEWKLTMRDATGKIVIENGGSQTRKE